MVDQKPKQSEIPRWGPSAWAREAAKSNIRSCQGW
jgi:hypothetical protein